MMRSQLWVLAAFFPVIASAQEGGPSAKVPQIMTSASADVALKPDRATLVFTVESRGTTAAQAGSETARKQLAVTDALSALGVATDQMTTVSIQINPEFVYPGENKPPKVSGYVARSSLQVEVLKIDQIGSLIDAALAKEATGIGSLEFSSSKAEEGRRHALELAVTKAKSDADVIARAAGGSLTGLIELQAQPSYDRPIQVNMDFSARAKVATMESMPVNPGQIKVSATVSGRWGFVGK